MSTSPSSIICLMGPTASGKTPLAIELSKVLPVEIISVDSAMVYRGMDIGTAKPDAASLQTAPHRLIDILDPSEHYSAGQFRQAAREAIKDIHAKGKIPLLVGGTMLYFRVLLQGLANLPPADNAIRAELKARAEKEGLCALHQALMTIDADAAKRIHVNDGKRIQRALEVYLLTGKPMSVWQKEDTTPLADYHIHSLALAPANRNELHARIEQRLENMLEQGLIEEVNQLHQRQDLHADLPALQAVGYKQVWAYLDNHLSYDIMREQTLAATRQLAKRQMTWLRSMPYLQWFDSKELTRVTDYLQTQYNR